MDDQLGRPLSLAEVEPVAGLANPLDDRAVVFGLDHRPHLAGEAEALSVIGGFEARHRRRKWVTGHDFGPER
jgi:hypothetical protein